MPWYASVYILGLAAISIASWQFGERLKIVPSWLRHGDLVATAVPILLTTAYWNEDLAEALGIVAPLVFTAWIVWFFIAIGPAVDAARRVMPQQGDASSRSVCASVALMALIGAPGMFWGFRVARAALGV